MAGFPRFEFSSQILPPRLAQLGDDFRIPRREPVLQFVQRLDGRQNGRGNFNGFRFHGYSVSRFPFECKCFVRMVSRTLIRQNGE